MTFIWTEISFLALWWQSAHPTRKVNLKKLVDEGRVFGFTCTFVFYRIEFSILLICLCQTNSSIQLGFFIGRFEILTGGWVMTDEANVELFSMVDQLVEGHQWLLHTLNFKPKSSWSVDPFGHGAAFPYVLKASGVDGKFYSTNDKYYN